MQLGCGLILIGLYHSSIGLFSSRAHLGMLESDVRVGNQLCFPFVEKYFFESDGATASAKQ